MLFRLRLRQRVESQRAMVAAKLANLQQGRPSEDKGANLPLLTWLRAGQSHSYA